MIQILQMALLSIVTIFFSVASSFVLINYVQWQYWNIDLGILEDNLFDRKPFNCEGCLSGWISLFTALFLGFSFYSILFMPVCVVLACVFTIMMKRGF